MPCRYFSDDEQRTMTNAQIENIRAELDILTRLMCKFADLIIENTDPDDIDAQEVQHWLESHQQKDKKRVRLEDKIGRMTVQARGPDRRKRK